MLVLPMVHQRPEITDLLGLGYRRIPILAIGNDIYCDSSLIIPVLERRFPPSQGYESVFPPCKHGGLTTTGLLKAFAKHYGDVVLMKLSIGLLSWRKTTPELLKDRLTLLGRSIDPMFAAARPKMLSDLSAHMALIEGQLQDGREWLFDTTSPSLADLSVHFVYAWVKFKGFPRLDLGGGEGFFPSKVVEELFDETKFPKTIEWMKCLTDQLN
ncbi:hypothetical protein L218DRAFT_897790 [Marasmius fiardii PR-910]|nr:hypothetical protein L218DRAFT_897790 [Marasmius fiardii PR-910]